LIDPVEKIDEDGPVLITCEHASQRMPPGWAWPDEDRWLEGTHWAFDLGAREIALELAEAMRIGAVLSRWSRLLVDPNRPEDSPTLFRERAEGRAVHLNTTHLHDEERARRIEKLLRPYHAEVDDRVRGSGARTLFSVHSFTPEYEGQVRTLEVGVLYDLDEDLPRRLAQHLEDAGLRVALNEPYSGKEGLMYSVDRHARAHGRQSVEIEVRQDLAMDAAFRARLVDRLADFFGVRS